MRKVCFNYDGINDYKSGRKYLAAASKDRQSYSTRQFLVLEQNFDHLEYLKLTFQHITIDDVFDNAMNSLVRLKTLDLTFPWSCEMNIASTKSLEMKNLEFLAIYGDFGLFAPRKEVIDHCLSYLNDFNINFDYYRSPKSSSQF